MGLTSDQPRRVFLAYCTSSGITAVKKVERICCYVGAATVLVCNGTTLVVRAELDIGSLKCDCS